MKKANVFKSIIKSWDQTSIQNELEINNESNNQNLINLSDFSTDSQNNFEWNGSVALWNLYESSWVTNSNNQDSSLNGKMLSGTTEYFGMLDIVSILWEKPQITLQDSRWNYFAYYWDHLDFIQTIKSLGGNIYEMVTESEILHNQLFGDKVSYINLSSFKDIRVLMVIEIDNDVWLLQIPADQYHYSKDYLKSLFIQ